MKAIKVSNGFVEGRTKTVLGKKVVEFLSIPYCNAPTNELRFQRPQAATFVDGIINQAEFTTCPPQLNWKISEDANPDEDLWNPKEVHSEDCLYVNVWSPLSVLEGSRKCAVLVWIYGGGFVSGSSSLPIYNGSLLSAQEDIIVVSFNYRVGMLGFLCLDDDVAGNQGIWDQVLALQWIHQNVEKFHGDPNNITLAGNSAGGCSVTLHLLIEESRSTFQRIIAQSGVCLSDWAFLPKSELIVRSEKIVNSLLEQNKLSLRWSNCLLKEDKDRILKELQRMDFREFLVDSEVCEGLLNFAWTPCIDGTLIKDKPEELFKNQRFKSCPSIFLNVENEGTLFILYEFPEIFIGENKTIDSKYFEKGFQYYPHFPQRSPPSLRDKIMKTYDIRPESMTIGDFDRIVGHRHFVSDSIQLANYVCGNTDNVYYMWYRTPSSSTDWPSWVGTMHSDEVYNLFGYNQVTDEGTVSKACEMYMRNIGEFIKNGSLPSELPRYEPGNASYILIENDQWVPATFTKDQIEKFQFWQQLKK